ncbi:MAG: MarR family winged helix-turn-helix transcriptional regulator [Candidatus Binataceae bacterium]
MEEMKSRPFRNRARQAHPYPAIQAPTAPAYVIDLLELFYPIHYRIGMALEDALRMGRLTRKQVAILWLIRSASGLRRTIERKQIEQLLSGWFEMSSSTITKSLRAMVRPPLRLIELAEHPKSGREKLVRLTAAGERFIARMEERGYQFVAEKNAKLSRQEIEGGLRYLRRVAEGDRDNSLV